ncbi:hypothetical protein [Cupriavidus sp. EM10]|uniref:hypothetical protein n=1 Tax=Cupriavidus sp. EM10 TaxID=2839983 RepID=UPI00351D873C
MWWQPGVYGSGPAVLLWIVARLPADMLASVFGTPSASALLNHAGDTVFVTGWLASAAWLWFTRKRPAPVRDIAPSTSPLPPRRRTPPPITGTAPDSVRHRVMHGRPRRQHPHDKSM